MPAALFNQGVYHAFTVGNDGTLYERWGNPPTNTNPIPGTNGRFVPGTDYDLDIARIVDDPGNPYFSAYFVSGRANGLNDAVMALWSGDHWEVYP
jgi:hypothetical protein